MINSNRANNETYKSLNKHSSISPLRFDEKKFIKETDPTFKAIDRR